MKDCGEASYCCCRCFVGKKKNQNQKRSRIMLMEDGGVWKGKRASSSSSSSEPRPCTECGKKFWSWKALFGHMRCHPERHWRGMNPPPSDVRRPHQPTTTTMVMSEEDHEVAACLLLLANSNKEKEKEKEEEVHFECSSCNKVFGSHQALGGHRASHKNVKGCFANNTNITNGMGMGMGMGLGMESVDGVGHKCSICLRVFSTGQALGGHKRCHWDNHKPDSSCVDLNFPPPTDNHHHSPLTLDLRLGL